MVSRRNERLGGLFMAAIGVMLTIWTWRSAIEQGHYYLLVAIGAPAFTTRFVVRFFGMVHTESGSEETLPSLNCFKKYLQIITKH